MAMALLFMLTYIFEKLCFKKNLEPVSNPTPYPEVKVMTNSIPERCPSNTKNQASNTQQTLSYSNKCIPLHMATQPVQCMSQVPQSRGP